MSERLDSIPRGARSHSGPSKQRHLTAQRADSKAAPTPPRSIGSPAATRPLKPVAVESLSPVAAAAAAAGSPTGEEAASLTRDEA